MANSEPRTIKGENRIKRNHIKTLRRYSRLTLKETAHLLQMYTGNHMDFTSVSRHQSGERVPDEATIHAYARIFKVPVYALYVDLTPEEQLIKIMRESAEYNFDAELMELASRQ